MANHPNRNAGPWLYQGERYAAEVLRIEGEGRPFKVFVFTRSIMELVDPNAPEVPTQWFDSLRSAKAWAKRISEQ